MTARHRCVPFGTRARCSELPAACWRPVTARYVDQHWRGIPIDKSPFELALLPMLLYEQGIRSVIELGAGAGGSAVWLADHLAGDPQARVLSVDISLAGVHPTAAADERIAFITGDCNNLVEVLTPSRLTTLPHPWLILEDAHDGLAEALRFVDSCGLCDGDYVIIEDTNLDLWQAWSDWPDRPLLECVRSKLDVIERWLNTAQSRYLVDPRYLDLFGFNASKQWNSVFRVCGPEAFSR